MTPPLLRRLFAELLGTGLLVTVVVGSGISAERLSSDVGVQLLENALVTAGGLAVLILVFGPVSGAHFNPVVSLADWILGYRRGSGLRAVEVVSYTLAQTAGAIAGAVLANVMFDASAVDWASHHRSGVHLWLGEVVATAGLLLVIISLLRSQRVAQVPWAVGVYIGAAYWFTSSTSFANPAVTVGRSFSDSFAGIAPISIPGFVVAQLIGGVVGLAVIRVLYPDAPAVANDVVVPHAP